MSFDLDSGRHSFKTKQYSISKIFKNYVQEQYIECSIKITFINDNSDVTNHVCDIFINKNATL